MKIWMILAAVFLTASFPAHAEENESWKLMLQRNYEELQYQIDYVDGVSQNLPGMVKQTRQDLSALRKKLDELMVLGRATGGNPMELRAILAGLDILQARVDAVTQPFQKADVDLRKFQERLSELEAEFARQAAEGSSQEITKALGDFLNDLRKLKGKLGRVKTVLDQGLSPTHDLQSGIGRSAQAVTERIPRAWKDYYLAPGKALLSIGAWQEAGQHMGDLSRFAALYSAFLDGGEAHARDVLVRLLGLVAVLVGVSAVALKRLEARIPGFGIWRPLGCLAWLSTGAAVLWATSGPAFVLVRAETRALAEICIARGVLGLSWFLRSRQLEGACPEKNPVGPHWWMFAFAVFLQMPWMPEALRGGAWVVILASAGWLARRAGAKAQGQCDVVSRLAAWSGALYPVLCLPALFGWMNVTMLAAEGWFLLLVFFQAGLSLYGLVERMAARPSHDLASEAIKGVVGGLALPLTAIGMAGCFLFWLSMAMGGRSVFWSLVSADVEESGFSLDLTRLAMVFVGFYLARAATRVADRLIAELPARRPDLERGVLNLLETMSTYVVWGLYVLVALRLAGASFTSLAVVAGGLSVGIGFGLQNIINNFISGLILLFGRSVQAGDILQVGEIWGTVRRVNIRNTVVQTFDNATLFVPNSDLIAQKIINWSHKDRRVRRTLEVGVAYGSDTAKVHGLLIRAASEHPNVLAEPKPIAQFTAFGDSSLNFKLLFWVDDLDNAPRASSEIHMAVDRIFREQGIDIPFPRRDVTVSLQAGSKGQIAFDSGGEEGQKEP